jgi:hypothetical protein
LRAFAAGTVIQVSPSASSFGGFAERQDEAQQTILQ